MQCCAFNIQFLVAIVLPSPHRTRPHIIYKRVIVEDWQRTGMMS